MRELFIIGCFVVTTAAAHPGIGIVEDRKGNIYYTDLAQVWRITADGKKSVVVPHVHTHELFIDASDNLYGEHMWYNGEALDTWGYFVWKLSPDGHYEKVVMDQNGFREDYSFVRDLFGRMYWADRSGSCQQVIRKNLDNTTARLADDCFQNIRWLKAARNGDLYVVDFTDLKRIDATGHVSVVGRKLDARRWSQFHVGDQHAVYGIWDDKDGNIYTAIYSGRIVKKFTPTGEEVVVAETPVPWSPSGGLVATNGDLWLLENSITNDVRVERIAVDGSRRVF